MAALPVFPAMMSMYFPAAAFSLPSTDASGPVKSARRVNALGWAGLLFAALTAVLPVTAASEPTGIAPTAIVASGDGKKLYVAAAGPRKVLVLDEQGAVERQMEMPAPPSGLALSPDGTRLAVTCAAPQSIVCLVDTARGRILERVPAGHTAMAPVFSPDGESLYVCNRYQHEVLVVAAKSGRVTARIPVEREPVAAAISRDGTRLWVANHLPGVAANGAHVAATVSVIDPAARAVVKSLRLPNGGNLVLGVAVSPDGRHVAVTHNLARFYVPTTQLERGWMNTAGLTLFDAARLEVINTVLLDSFESGAANPWAVAWSADGRNLLVTHAGTHELSVIDFPALLAKLEALPADLPRGQAPDYTRATNVRSDVPNDLAFLTGLRRRVKLGGNGPRALSVSGDHVRVAGYFSDTIETVDLGARVLRPASRALGASGPMSEVRRGEMWFNDATLCFQQWQSCASCHSYDARVDGLNWDLLNDGIGNPKNAKSLLWSHRTPPAMSLSARESAEVAVRAGIRHILFAVPPDGVAAAMDSYLKALQPEPSPYLEKGRLSRAAQRGKKLFEDARVGCATCHPGPLFTDLKSYDVGTAGRYDKPGLLFDTPTLVELWRSGPFLHDGSAVTIRDVLNGASRAGKHGQTGHLSPQELEELAAYILSL
ncbi:MAG: cell surface protein [Verrucomicrobia bacterium]|nr:cell surface protein [Verrucomicrobiota bacterium]